MSENDRNPFQRARAQVDEAARILDLAPAICHLLRWPRRECHIAIPVRLDSGAMPLFQAYRVQYNDARGPARGGLRLHPAETIDTVRALAAWMSWQAALVDVPLGGGWSGVVCHRAEMSQGELERLTRATIRALGHYAGAEADVPWPDLYTPPPIAAWMMDEISTIRGHHMPAMTTGQPLGVSGRADATARGGVYALREAAQTLGLDLPRSSVAIQGYGPTGQRAHRLVIDILGARVVALSEAEAGIYSPDGITLDEGMAWQRDPDSGRWRRVTSRELLELEVDILLLAGLESQVGGWNAGRVRARVVAELAHTSIAPAADEVLHHNGVHVIPDLMGSAGPLLVSYLVQAPNARGADGAVHDVPGWLDQKMTAAFHAVYSTARQFHVHNRLAAYLVAIGRVAEAMQLQGWI